jgi:hypothetical protein
MQIIHLKHTLSVTVLEKKRWQIFGVRTKYLVS